MKVINRKALTLSVLGRFDLSMTPLLPSHAGGCRPTVLVFLSSLLTPPACRGHRGAEPCAED